MNGKNNEILEELRNKTILLVNTGSIKKRFILQQLKKLGLKIVVLNKEKNWAQSYIDHWIIADTGNFKECVQAIQEYLKNNSDLKLDGACTFWEDDVLLTSKIIDTFNFIGIPYRIAQKARNKFLFREFCEQKGIRAPQHALLKNADDCKHVIENFTFPLVVKPAYGASSAYVVKVENEEDLYSTYEYIRKNITTEIESALANGLDILVEEYIGGNEVDIDILLQNGKIKFYSITDNFQTREPFFVETGDAIPSSLPAWEQRKLVELAEEVLEKMGIQNGCIHFEAKTTKDGPVPIEVNLRMGGDYVHSFVKGAWGVDLIENAVKIACGIYIRHIPKPERPLKFLAGKYFIPDYSGILAKLDIDEKLRKSPRLEEVSFYKKIGDPVLVPPEGYEFLGWFTASGDNLIDTQDNIRDLEKDVTFEVARFNRDSFIGRTSRRNRFSAASLNKDILLRVAKKENIRRVSISDLRSLRIGIAFNTYGEKQSDREKIFTETARNIEQTLKGIGYDVSMFDFNVLAEVFELLRSSNVDLVINTGARMIDSNYGDVNAAALLDMLDIPYTGSDPVTLSVCRDATRIKKLLQFHNIPTPKWDYVYTLEDEIRDDFRYPLIVKPIYSNSAVAMGQESVVVNKEKLLDIVGVYIKGHKTPVIIEEFIEGDEYRAMILGNESNVRVLPLFRTIFQNMPQGIWPANFQYGDNIGKGPENILMQCPPKNIPKKLESLITEMALDAYNILECEDYSEVKIRVDKDFNPHIIGVDPSPSLHTQDLVASAAVLAGLRYSELVEEIMRLAAARYKNQ
jgi:D-alanine-D-alanine ligase-like ATP-grasp enzyme